MITHKNYKQTISNLRLFFIGEIGNHIKQSGSMEKLSILLGRSITYVRIILDRNPDIDKLQKLYEECKKKLN